MNLRTFFAKSVSCMFLLVILLIAALLGGCRKVSNLGEEVEIQGPVYEENGLPKNQKVVLRIIYPEQGYGTELFEKGIKSFEEKFPNVKF